MVTHTEGIEYLVHRLCEKGRVPLVEVGLYNGNRLISDADVMTVDSRNGIKYVTRYEVKSGNGKKTARRQCKRWYAMMETVPDCVPNFVYYNCRDNILKRWGPPPKDISRD